MQFETQPGGALLAGTVRHLVAERVMRLAGRVTRLNKYGNTSWCMPERQLLLYCFCADQLEVETTTRRETFYHSVDSLP